jgi:Leucine-rich repeat (LRR) protein
MFGTTNCWFWVGEQQVNVKFDSLRSFNRLKNFTALQNVPNIKYLDVQANKVQELTFLWPLQCLRQLWVQKNPVVTNPLYRLYILSELWNLQQIDGLHISDYERERAEELRQSLEYQE